jgi:hypothetical protein
MQLADVLAHQEHRGQVQIDDLLPCLQGMVDGRGTPSRSGVIHEDIDRSKRRDGALDGWGDRTCVGHVANQRQRGDSEPRLEMRGGIVELVALARRQCQLGAHFPEGLGHLQPQAARSTRHQCRPARYVEELLDAHDDSFTVGHRTRPAHCPIRLDARSTFSINSA